MLMMSLVCASLVIMAVCLMQEPPRSSSFGVLDATLIKWGSRLTRDTAKTPPTACSSLLDHLWGPCIMAVPLQQETLTALIRLSPAHALAYVLARKLAEWVADLVAKWLLVGSCGLLAVAGGVLLMSPKLRTESSGKRRINNKGAWLSVVISLIVFLSVLLPFLAEISMGGVVRYQLEGFRCPPKSAIYIPLHLFRAADIVQDVSLFDLFSFYELRRSLFDLKSSQIFEKSNSNEFLLQVRLSVVHWATLVALCMLYALPTLTGWVLMMFFTKICCKSALKRAAYLNLNRNFAKKTFEVLRGKIGASTDRRTRPRTPFKENGAVQNEVVELCRKKIIEFGEKDNHQEDLFTKPKILVCEKGDGNLSRDRRTSSGRRFGVEEGNIIRDREISSRRHFEAPSNYVDIGEDCQNGNTSSLRRLAATNEDTGRFRKIGNDYEDNKVSHLLKRSSRRVEDETNEAKNNEYGHARRNRSQKSDVPRTKNWSQCAEDGRMDVRLGINSRRDMWDELKSRTKERYEQIEQKSSRDGPEKRDKATLVYLDTENSSYGSDID